MRINDLLNAVKHVAAGRDRTLLLEAFPDLPIHGILPSGIPGDGILVDKEYYAAKDVLIMDEQVLLRVTNFDLCFQHPHKYLFNYARTLGSSGAMVRIALGLVNDSLLRTKMCLSCQPWEVAAGALHVSSLLTGEVHEIPHSGPVSWWDGLGVSLSRVEAVGHLLMDMLPSLPASEQRGR
eukprot:jgi/Botrbrau1/17791/Bobra.0127s0042.2